MWYWSADTLFWQLKFLECIDNEILLPLMLRFQLTQSGLKKLPIFHLHCEILFTRQRNIHQHFWTKFGVNRSRSTTPYWWPLCAHKTAHIILRQRWITGVCFFLHSIAFCVKSWTMYVLPFSFIVPLFEQTAVCSWSLELSASSKAHPVLFLQERLPLCYWGELESSIQRSRWAFFSTGNLINLRGNTLALMTSYPFVLISWIKC